MQSDGQSLECLGRPSNPYAVEEISTIDLCLILLRRRWWLIGTLVVTLAAVAMFLVFTRPLYESRAILRIGQVTSMVGSATTPLESSEALVSSLRARFHLNRDDTATIKPPKVTDVIASKRLHGLVTLTARGYNPVQVQTFLQKTVAAIVNRQRQRFDQAMQVRRTYLVNLHREQKRLRSQASSISKQFDKPGSGNAFTLNLDSLLLKRIGVNEAQIVSIQDSMTPPQSMPTTVLAQPSLPVKQIYPKLVLTIVLSIVGGALLGLIAAFCVEFVFQAREEMRRRQSGSV